MQRALLPSHSTVLHPPHPQEREREREAELERKEAEEREKEAAELFRDLLREKGVAAFSKWDTALPKLAHDPRFKAVANHNQRRRLFDAYVKQRAEEERKEKREVKKQAVDGFAAILDEIAAAAGGSLPLDLTLEQIEAKYKCARDFAAERFRRTPRLLTRAPCHSFLPLALLRCCLSVSGPSQLTRASNSRGSPQPRPLSLRGDSRLVEVERKTLQAKLDARMVPALQEEKIRLRERAAAVRLGRLRPPGCLNPVLSITRSIETPLSLFED